LTVSQMGRAQGGSAPLLGVKRIEQANAHRREIIQVAGHHAQAMHRRSRSDLRTIDDRTPLIVEDSIKEIAGTKLSINSYSRGGPMTVSEINQNLSRIVGIDSRDASDDVVYLQYTTNNISINAGSRC